MAKELPKILQFPGIEIQVVQLSLKDSMGYWDPKDCIIVINKDQPEAGKWVTLLHESMHVINDLMIVSEKYSKRWDHETITHIAWGLMAFMTVNGLTDLVSIKELWDLEELLSNVSHNID